MSSEQSIVTFKADASLVEALRAVPNRSAFIRTAILAALENQCPLCAGTGILTPEQKRHWSKFAQDHAVKECAECHEWHLVCAHAEEDHAHEAGRQELGD
ncbi:MAG TPA: CopG family transcriptional regulator [Phycisphaerae bacterium]|nr:CopG family transcriptional regulator [Phycisphaerae bacterium]